MSPTQTQVHQPLPGETAPSGTGFDRLLQASRRVDWRFLLPNSQLRDVACLGAADESLLESLRLFSESLTVPETDGASQQERSLHDVVVVVQPSQALLGEAARQVGPDGCLYVEISRCFGIGRTRRRRTDCADGRRSRVPGPSRCLADLAALGFEECRLHWHWPDFEHCTDMIPLDDPAAAKFRFRQHGSGLKKRCLSMVGARLAETGLLPRLVGCYSVVAQKKRRQP